MDIRQFMKRKKDF